MQCSSSQVRPRNAEFKALLPSIVQERKVHFILPNRHRGELMEAIICSIHDAGKHVFVDNFLSVDDMSEPPQIGFEEGRPKIDVSQRATTCLKFINRAFAGHLTAMN